jgi:GNAT superfamily N-acetyltransferase
MSVFDPGVRLALSRQRQEELLRAGAAGSGRPRQPKSWRQRRRAAVSPDPRFEDVVVELRRGRYALTTDRSRLDLEMIHRYLAEESYWGRYIGPELLQQAIWNSLCVGLYRGRQQVGFGRAITDYATFGYLADVFVLKGHRRRGLGTWLVEALLSHPALSGCQRWLLRTKDAHAFYARLGFTPLAPDRRLMIRDDRYPDIRSTGAILRSHAIIGQDRDQVGPAGGLPGDPRHLGAIPERGRERSR